MRSSNISLSLFLYSFLASFDLSNTECPGLSISAITLRAEAGSDVTLKWSYETVPEYIAFQKCSLEIDPRIVAEIGWGIPASDQANLEVSAVKEKEIRLTFSNITMENAMTYYPVQEVSGEPYDKAYALFIWGQPSRANIKANRSHVVCNVTSSSQPKKLRQGWEYYFYIDEEVKISRSPELGIIEGNNEVNYSCAAREIGSSLMSDMSDVVQVGGGTGEIRGRVHLNLVCETNCVAEYGCSITWLNTKTGQAVGSGKYLPVNQSDLEEPLQCFARPSAKSESPGPAGTFGLAIACLTAAFSVLQILLVVVCGRLLFSHVGP